MKWIGSSMTGVGVSQEMLMQGLGLRLGLGSGLGLESGSELETGPGTGQVRGRR